jgi:hypothetical protein
VVGRRCQLGKGRSKRCRMKKLNLKFHHSESFSRLEDSSFLSQHHLLQFLFKVVIWAVTYSREMDLSVFIPVHRGVSDKVQYQRLQTPDLSQFITSSYFRKVRIPDEAAVVCRYSSQQVIVNLTTIKFTESEFQV